MRYVHRLILDGIPRRWVAGARVRGKAVEFPHMHPESDCAICAWILKTTAKLTYRREKPHAATAQA